MKKMLKLPLFLLVAFCIFGTALAAGGDASDPLASLSYLNTVFWNKVDGALKTKLDASDATLLQYAKSQGGSNADAPSSIRSAAPTELRLKQGDGLTGYTGLTLTPMAGSVKVTFYSGAVVDVTAGVEMASGSTLLRNHRYLVAENTDAVFVIASQTAVVYFEGSYALATSATTDYNAMAAALKKMNLFKGSFTGYGSGYDLELAPTRLQALIMFIRLLGEEEAALAWTGSVPFSDIEKGSQAACYVGYALSKGYTNGYTPTQFKPAQAANANQYVEFTLRALGYSSTANTDLSTTMERAQAAGVLTSGESFLLKNELFLRAHLVYVSYYVLQSPISGSGQTLQQRLITNGVFTQADAFAAHALIFGKRL